MPRPSSDPRDLDAVPSFLRERAPRSSSVRPGASEAAAGPDMPEAGRSAGTSRGGDRIDPASLPLPSLSRRRLAFVAGAVAAVWLVLAFGRQVGEASAASTRADDLRGVNTQLHQDVDALQQDLVRVQDENFVQLQARAFGLGGRGEIPFTLAAGSPSLAPNAPGSAAVRLGATVDQRSPLEVWLTTLFGPDH